MLHVLWFLLLAGEVVYGAVHGRIDEVTQAIFSGAQSGVMICFGLLSVLIFWLGIMNIAQEGGIVRALARVCSPLVCRLFPSVSRGDAAIGYIVTNVCANVLGLGNAATPAGMKAMEALQKNNRTPQEATPAMCTLLALNTASLTLIPTTMIGLRMQAGSQSPTDIIIPTIVATACSLLFALLIDRWAQKFVS
jgi:spore maturation protein A